LQYSKLPRSNVDLQPAGSDVKIGTGPVHMEIGYDRLKPVLYTATALSEISANFAFCKWTSV